MKKHKYLVIFLLLAAGAAAFLVFWESDVDRILKNLNRLGDAISKTGKEKNTALVFKTATLKKFCAADCVVGIRDSRILPAKGIEEILGQFRALWPQVSPQHVVFKDVLIRVDDDGRTAECNLNAFLITQNRQNELRRSKEFQIRMDWVKHGGEWRLLRATGDQPPAGEAAGAAGTE